MSKGPEVILIDDECCTLELHKLTVKSVMPGAEVRGYLSARTALEYLRHKDPEDMGAGGKKSIILSDLHMPVIDGFGFLDEYDLLPRIIRNHYSVFVLSADADMADTERLTKKPNLAGFLTKPLTVQKFTAILRKIGYE
jgi:CheY-like chemotaxis protein